MEWRNKQMKRKKVSISLFLLLLFSMLLMGCQNDTDKSVLGETEETEEILSEEDELLVAVNVDGSVTELPFENVWMNRSKFWGGLIFQGLLIADENISNVAPDLCEEYIISTDGRKYTFILKENLLWHDGKILTTEDVIWSIETFLKVQETNGYIKKGLQGILGAEEFERGETVHIRGIEINGNDITITLKEDDASFLSSIGQLAILPKHCLEDVTIEDFSSCDFWKNPVGSGPYKIVENIDNKEAVFVVNKHYSGKIPAIKQIRYKVLEYPGTDNFDFTITSDPVTINRYSQNAQYKVVKSNNLYYRYLIFNLDKRTGDNEQLLKEPKVRRALMLALDKERIIKEIYKGAALTLDSGIPANDSWYIIKDAEDVGYNPKLAKELLQQVEFDFDKTIILTRYSMDDLSEKLLDEVAECWRSLGIKVEIIPIESDSTNKLFVEADWYDIALKNLSAVDYTEWYYEYSSENQLWSQILYNRKEFDTLINSINHSSYANELKMLYSEIQKMENKLVYKIPIAIVPQYVIYNQEHVYIPEKEFPNLWFYFDLDLADWSIKK